MSCNQSYFPISRNYILFTVAGFLFLQGCQPSEPEEVKVYFESGELKSLFFLKDGKKDGEYIDYLIDGSVRSKYRFENDLQSGKTEHFYKDGALKEVQYYAAGKREQGDTVFYPDGKIQFTTSFKEDKKNGYLRKWDQNGEILFEAKYDMGKLIEVKGDNVVDDEELD